MMPDGRNLYPNYDVSEIYDDDVPLGEATHRSNYSFEDAKGSYYDVVTDKRTGEHTARAFASDMQGYKDFPMNNRDFKTFMAMSDAQKRLFMQQKFASYIDLASIKSKGIDMPDNKDLANVITDEREDKKSQKINPSLLVSQIFNNAIDVAQTQNQSYHR